MNKVVYEMRTPIEKPKQDSKGLALPGFPNATLAGVHACWASWSKDMQWLEQTDQIAKKRVWKPIYAKPGSSFDDPVLSLRDQHLVSIMNVVQDGARRLRSARPWAPWKLANGSCVWPQRQGSASTEVSNTVYYYDIHVTTAFIDILAKTHVIEIKYVRSRRHSWDQCKAYMRDKGRDGILINFGTNPPGLSYYVTLRIESINNLFRVNSSYFDNCQVAV